jgi:hypothetical protein
VALLIAALALTVVVALLAALALTAAVIFLMAALAFLMAAMALVAPLALNIVFKLLLHNIKCIFRFFSFRRGSMTKPWQ